MFEDLLFVFGSFFGTLPTWKVSISLKASFTNGQTYHAAKNKFVWWFWELFSCFVSMSVGSFFAVFPMSMLLHRFLYLCFLNDVWYQHESFLDASQSENQATASRPLPSSCAFLSFSFWKPILRFFWASEPLLTSLWRPESIQNQRQIKPKQISISLKTPPTHRRVRERASAPRTPPTP